MKSFFGKLVVAIFCTFMVSGISGFSVVGIQGNAYAILFAIVGMPILTFLCVMFTKGAIRSIGTGMIFLGFSISFIPLAASFFAEKLEEGLNDEIANGLTKDEGANAELLQIALETFASVGFWFGVIVGLFLMAAGLFTLKNAHKNLAAAERNKMRDGWLEI